MYSLTALTALVIALLPFLAQCSRLTPPVLPLIVRNPYLSTWLPNARDVPWEKWPMHWAGQEVGFGILASLPSTRTAYPLLGRPHDSLSHDGDDGYKVSYPIYKGATYDASTTNLTYSITPQDTSQSLDITISFLSPITPTSTLRQSIPASYITIYVSGTTAVDIYIDLNGHWVTGDRGNRIVWDLGESRLKDSSHGLKTWKFRRHTEELFVEWNDRAEWGSLHFTAPSDVRHESGTSALLRQRFSRTGTLQNEIDGNPRRIMDEEPVFAFSKSFQRNSTTASKSVESVMFTIAHVQDPVVQYAAARGLTMMRPLWESYFLSPVDLLMFHYYDFEHAAKLAYDYDAQLAIDAYESGSDDYVDIVTLSARQVLGAVVFAGTPEDPLLFLKEISSNGNCQTIDVIFPAFPFFLYTNPRWLAYLLEPLIEHMLSGQYPNKYAMHDLGAHFPNMTGHADGRDEYMPVEECGNILIMGLALANSIRFKVNTSTVSTWQAVGDQPSSLKGAFSLGMGQQDGVSYIDEAWAGGVHYQSHARQWVDRSYRLWNQWTGYLVEFTLRPETQLSTDDFAGWLSLQTNLALKGIIGIKAMEGLAEITGHDADAEKYKNISEAYIAKWEDYAISRDKTHAKLAYHWYGSWTTLYNLYADALLCFHLGDADSSTEISGVIEPFGKQKPFNGIKDDTVGFVPRHIYQMQSDWYYAVRQKYGMPLDSRHLYTKTDWEFFAMAVAAPHVRADILQSVAKWVNETATDRSFTDLHQTEGDGGFPGPNFFARPVVGGHFAFLTLKKACGGKAAEGLSYLDDSVTRKAGMEDEDEVLRREIEEARTMGRYAHMDEKDVSEETSGGSDADDFYLPEL